LSEYVPVAVNCFVEPTAIIGFAGVTEIETSVVADVGVVIVKVVVPETPPEIAVIVVDPDAIAVANPAFDTVALLVSDEDHATEPVRF
jgi:hypothetical protein